MYFQSLLPVCPSIIYLVAWHPNRVWMLVSCPHIPSHPGIVYLRWLGNKHTCPIPPQGQTLTTLRLILFHRCCSLEGPKVVEMIWRASKSSSALSQFLVCDEVWVFGWSIRSSLQCFVGFRSFDANLCFWSVEGRQADWNKDPNLQATSLKEFVCSIRVPPRKSQVLSYWSNGGIEERSFPRTRLME